MTKKALVGVPVELVNAIKDLIASQYWTQINAGLRLRISENMSGHEKIRSK